METNKIGGPRADITEMLSKIREVSNKSNIFTENKVKPATNNFESALNIAKQAISNVNDAQKQSEQLKTAFVSGDSNVSMSQVVIASQKSKLAFEGLVAVRNKILDAYKDIMNMPV